MGTLLRWVGLGRDLLVLAGEEKMFLGVVTEDHGESVETEVVRNCWLFL